MKRIWIFIGMLMIAFASIGFWFWQRNSYSKADLKFEIIAPKETVAGDEMTYTVQWKNNGQASLEHAVLVFEYPEGSLPSLGNSKRNTLQLKEIYPGQEQTKQFKGRLFGKEGDVKEAKASLGYAPKNINARYEAFTQGTTVISFVSLNFELDLPAHIESEQQFSFALNYFSNSQYPLADLRIKIDYPDGFEFQSAVPAPIGKNEWKLGVLNKAQGGRITIRGSLQGQLQEAKIFHATLGSWKDGEFTLLKDSAKGVDITKPQIQIAQTINGNTPPSVSPGQMLHYEILFKNVSERDLENLFLIVALEGNAFDVNTLKAEGGSFQAGDNSVVWDARSVPKLRLLGRGESGKVEFWVAIRQDADPLNTDDSNLVARNRILLSEAKEEFEVKVSSKLVIEQKGYFQDEVFGNEGPLPPQSESKTTYTIIWQVKNYFNNVRSAKVTAVLPKNVELTGKVFPEDSHVTFDSASREVVWAVGDLPAGAGVIGSPISTVFQVALQPQASQRGGPAELLGQATITGDDTWTVQSVSGVSAPIDTTIPNDPSAEGKGIVQ